MKLSRLLRGVKVIDWHADRSTEISHLTSDSRLVKRGSLFVAVQGVREDGQRYLADARVNGAVAALVQRPPEGDMRDGIPWVQVSDPARSLVESAKSFFGDPSGRMSVVGVTGTNGKTTFAYLVESLLESAGRPAGVIGTVNHRVRRKSWPSRNTTPGPVELHGMLSDMARMGARICVMEVSSHALDQRRVDGIEFDVAVFTNLSQDHLDYHVDMESYGKAKRRFFTEVLAASRKKRRTAVLNVDQEFGRALAAEIKFPVIRYGWEQGDVRVLQSRSDERGTDAVLLTPEGPMHVHTSLAGRHNVYNILAAAATGLALGLKPEDIRKGIFKLRSVPGRMEKVEQSGKSVWVDYAHTPEALRHALIVARSVTPGRVTCVFGCGGDRDRGKRPLMGRIASRLSNRLVLTSDNPRSEDPMRILEDIRKGVERDGGIEILTVPDRRQAIVEGIRGCAKGDSVLLAGKGHEDVQILGNKRIQFSDVAVAREALRAHAG